MKSLIIIILILLPQTAKAEDWIKNPNMWAVLTLTTVDWAQTRWFSRHYDEGHYETNPFLGKYPSTQKIDLFIGASMLTHLVVNASGGKKFKAFWNSFWIVTELNAININYKAGVKIKW